MRARNILFSILFAFFQLAGALFAKDRSEVINVTDSIQYLKIHVVNDVQKVKPCIDKDYYWYYSNQINCTRGGFSGRLLDGDYLSFYFNSELKESGKFCIGLKDGIWKSWFEGGKLKEITDFDNGYKDGESIRFSISGDTIFHGYYKKNKLNGKALFLVNGEMVIRKFKKGLEVIPKSVAKKEAKQQVKEESKPEKKEDDKPDKKKDQKMETTKSKASKSKNAKSK